MFAAPEPVAQYGPYPPPGMVAMPVQPAYPAPRPAQPVHAADMGPLAPVDRTLAVLFCFFGGVAYTLPTHPTSSDAASTPNCIIKLTTGFDCPGCGGTRAFFYLMHGNVLAAARSHLLLVFAPPYLVYMYVAWAAGAMFNWKLPPFGPLRGRSPCSCCLAGVQDPAQPALGAVHLALRLTFGHSGRAGPSRAPRRDAVESQRPLSIMPRATACGQTPGARPPSPLGEQ